MIGALPHRTVADPLTDVLLDFDSVPKFAKDSSKDLMKPPENKLVRVNLRPLSFLSVAFEDPSESTTFAKSKSPDGLLVAFRASSSAFLCVFEHQLFKSDVTFFSEFRASFKIICASSPISSA